MLLVEAECGEHVVSLLREANEQTTGSHFHGAGAQAIVAQEADRLQKMVAKLVRGNSLRQPHAPPCTAVARRHLARQQQPRLPAGTS